MKECLSQYHIKIWLSIDNNLSDDYMIHNDLIDKDLFDNNLIEHNHCSCTKHNPLRDTYLLSHPCES